MSDARFCRREQRRVTIVHIAIPSLDYGLQFSVSHTVHAYISTRWLTLCVVVTVCWPVKVVRFAQ